MSCFHKAGVYHSSVLGGTPRAEAAAPSQTKSSSRAGPHGLHQSGGSPGARRVTERRGLFPPSDWKLRLGAAWGIAAPPSSARRPHPSESSGARGSARKPLGSGERLSPSGLHRAGPRPRSVKGGTELPYFWPFTPDLLPIALAALASGSLFLKGEPFQGTPAGGSLSS